MRHVLLLVSAILLLANRTAAAAEVDYIDDVKSMLRHRCFACHGPLKQESELRLDTAAAIRRGGDNGPAIKSGKADKSLLIEKVTAADPDARMPPEGDPLTKQQIEILKAWINAGGPAPADEQPEKDPRQHWAFQRPVRPEVPEAKDPRRQPKNPIDAFILAERRRLNLKPVGEVEKSLLLRRVYLDLSGLPPTRGELRAFLADTGEGGYEKIVERLLRSPHYGERWGRHWMDIWRYTDWFGLGAQLRYSQKHIWHWRDWIIESLIADKGYDQMILEMLAADEIAPTDQDKLRATGFLARNYFLFNRTRWLDDTIEHTSKAFLGLTLNCAKCHDHKYDPITQVDYYSMRAILEPHQVRLDPVPGETDLEKNGLPRVFDDHLDAKTFLHTRGDPKNPDKKQAITPGVPAILASFAPEIRPVKLPAFAYAPATRDHVRKDRLRLAEEKLAAAGKALEEAKKVAVTKTAEKAVPAKETKPETAPPSRFEVKDNFDKPNPEKWELSGDGWEYRDGALILTKSTRDNTMLRLRQSHPRDFELTCRYTHTGGATYKSVTFRFDQSQDRKYENFIYTSAHVPNPKLHVAHARNGKTTYPPEGMVSKPIKVGETYLLRFAVRDRLINAWLNDEFVVAYNLPDRRTGGSISLAGFDATVAFDSIIIRSLPDDLELTKAKNSPTGKQDPKHSVELAEAGVAAARAQLKSIEATFEADTARFRGAVAGEALQALLNDAARKEAELAIAKARQDLLATPGDAGKVKAANKRIAEAEKKIEDATAGKAKYSSIRAARKALESPAHKEADYPVSYPETSTGRRTSLAHWITHPQNPLTARVAANHIWSRHFGQPLVETVTDFGLRAKRPPQHALLDWLAVELLENGWRMKHLHRLIVTSQTYRLSTSATGTDPATKESDPNNNFYWRRRPLRMESQVIRDSLLQLAGVLDPKLGGPTIDPKQGDSTSRRSIYFTHSRDDQNKFLSMFDDADILRCYRRNESIIPQQALTLANSKLSLSMSRKIAQQLGEEAGNDETLVKSVFETILCRQPDSGELAACIEALIDLRESSKQNSPTNFESRARANFVHAILNHNDFVTIR